MIGRRVEEERVESVRVREGDGGGGNWRDAGEGSSGAGEEDRVERREEVSDIRAVLSVSEEDEGSGRAI